MRYIARPRQAVAVVIALTIITAVMVALLTGLGWLIYVLRPETVRVSAKFAKLLHLELEMKSPPRGNS